MSITSGRAIVATFGTTLEGSFQVDAATNTNAPTSVTVHNLPTGNNTIVLPTGGVVVAAATIIPPVGNTSTITLKGTNADTGIVLHPTDPTSIAFSTTQSQFVLTVSTTVSGLRIIWT